MILRLSFIVAIAAWLAAPRPARADDGPLVMVVIVAKDSKLTGISRADLRHAFAGDAVTAGGGRLVPFNLGTATSQRVLFDRVILGMVPAAVGRYWVDRKIRGGNGAPRALPSSAYVVKVVAKFPNAIGYVPANQVTGAVKVITIDGVGPGQVGYPLAER